MKAGINKLDINKLINFPTSLNNLKTKADGFGVAQLKAPPVDLKGLSHVVDNEVVKNIKFNALKRKVNNLDKKNSNATTLILIYQ